MLQKLKHCKKSCFGLEFKALQKIMPYNSNVLQTIMLWNPKHCKKSCLSIHMHCKKHALELGTVKIML